MKHSRKIFGPLLFLWKKTQTFGLMGAKNTHVHMHLSAYLHLSVSLPASRYCLSETPPVRGGGRQGPSGHTTQKPKPLMATWVVVPEQPGNLLLQGFIIKTLIIIKLSVCTHSSDSNEEETGKGKNTQTHLGHLILVEPRAVPLVL